MEDVKRIEMNRASNRAATTWGRGRARDPQRGGAAVEFALVLPLFMMLVMGALDYGYFFFSDQVVTNAAREGAREGTLTDTAGNTPSGAEQSAATTAATTKARAYMDGNGVACGPPGGSSCINATYTTVPGNPSISVVISYEYHGLTGFLPVILPRHVYASAVMRWR
jgi:Flp pilus assembly protein TadG